MMQIARVVARFDADPKGRGHLDAFHRRPSPCVRQVHGGERRLELRPNDLRRVRAEL